MASLSYQRIDLDGLAPAHQAADAVGDGAKPHSRGFLSVKNAGAGAVTVTVETPGETEFGVDQPDVAVSVAAGGESLIGPLAHDLASDPDTGEVRVSYSAVASVTVAVLYV